MDLEKIPITHLKGVGEKLATTFAKLGVSSLQDLIFHLPFRYVDRTRIVSIGALSPNQSAVIQGEVLSAQILFGRRRSLAVTIADASGKIALRFFHFNAAQKEGFRTGRSVRCFGEARLGATGLELYHPEYEFVDADNTDQALAQTLTPIYSLTDGITQPRMRSTIALALQTMERAAPQELLPSEIIEELSAINLSEALQYLHNPPKDAPVEMLLAGLHPFQKRLAFEELLAHNLAVQKSRKLAKADLAPTINVDLTAKQAFLAQLPFSLTRAQQRVIEEIEADVLKTSPMTRLVQGDVGSGKTLVAAVAALAAIQNQLQVALVAPTEILAEQHLKNFRAWFNTFNIEVGWLAGKISATERRHNLAGIADGSIQIAVGTHALFQENVSFKALGLVIVDEQHRFGVHQRLALRNKGSEFCPHQLIMTATPIPRTLAMTAYADLDVSTIDELPAGRKPINTSVIGQNRRAEVIQRVRAACVEGQQAYWVCTLIENSETLTANAAQETFAALANAMPELKIGLVHGRLKPAEKEQVMSEFKRGDLKLLVATTVIEVGVDVPNATLMIIENPERLGLAQLHQLRGRVGRGSGASHCVLLYGEPLSRMGRERLQVLRDSNSGFVIAQKDLELRGPGELLGTLQTGQMQFRTADLMRDEALIERVQHYAKILQHNQPDICEKIIQRWYAHEQDYVKV